MRAKHWELVGLSLCPFKLEKHILSTMPGIARALHWLQLELLLPFLFDGFQFWLHIRTTWRVLSNPIAWKWGRSIITPGDSNVQPRLRNSAIAGGHKLECVSGSPGGFVKIIPGPHLQSFKFSRYRPALHFIPSSVYWLFPFVCSLYCSTHYLTSSRSITLLKFFLKTFANNLFHANGLNIHQPILVLDTIHHVSKFSPLNSEPYSLCFLLSFSFPNLEVGIPMWDSHHHMLGSLYLSLKKNAVFDMGQTWVHTLYLGNSLELWVNSHFSFWWVMGNDNSASVIIHLWHITPNY